MPEKATIERARRDLRAGKSASTAAGEFVKQEMDHIREGKHGAKSAKQAIAIGLSEARRAGVPLKRPDEASDKPARKRAAKKGNRVKAAPVSPKRSRAAERRLKREPRRAASHLALSRQAHTASRKRTATQRSVGARKAARTRAKR